MCEVLFVSICCCAFYLRGTNLDKSSLGGHFLGDLDGLVVRLFDGIADLLEHELNVGGLRGVLSNTTVRSVSSATSGRGLVALGVVDDAVVNVQSLGLGVGDGVQQQVLVNGGRLDGPSSGISRSLELLGHTLVSNSSGEFDERNNGLVAEDIVKVLEGLVDLHSLGDVSDLTAVLEVHTEVGSAGLGVGDSGIGLDSVTGHDEKVLIQKYTNTDC